jgi:hypothetical protein
MPANFGVLRQLMTLVFAGLLYWIGVTLWAAGSTKDWRSGHVLHGLSVRECMDR